MGVAGGIPTMANDSGSRAYVQVFGEALHVELKRHGISARYEVDDLHPLGVECLQL